jgi:peptidase M50B-like protein
VGEFLGPGTPGSPGVFIGGLVALILVVFTDTWAESLVTVAHEGGHAFVALLSGREVFSLRVNETTGGGATRHSGGWGVGRIFISLAGYITPPLLGLAGATLVVAGKSWSVLGASIVLLVGAFVHARDNFTSTIIVLATLGIGWAAVEGPPPVQGLLAVVLAWWMLFGGVRQLQGMGLGVSGSDAANLARFTWIPAIVWVAFFWFVALLCLFVGGRRLLGF